MNGDASRSLSPPPATLQSRSSRFSYRNTSSSPSKSDAFSRSRSRARSTAPLIASKVDSKTSPVRQKSYWNHFKFRRDYRADLPEYLARFTGYRSPGRTSHPPLAFPPFSFIKHLSSSMEAVIFGWVGAFVGVVLVESIMIKSSVLEGYGVPLIIGSFGATAVLIYGTIEAPLAQPRNCIGGQFLSALTSVIITRLFRLSSSYRIDLNTRPDDFPHLVWLNAALSMATSLTVQQLTGTLHPPGGATALLGAIQPNVVDLSWKYLLIILVSTLVMTGWALVINNLGRRRYPVFWWSPKSTFVNIQEATDKTRLEELAEEEERIEEMREGEELGSGEEFRGRDKSTRGRFLR